ncbi:MAG: transposase [Sphingomonadales bacterium GWF1_63_6]|nr:MAG: transposase [Sphingomonadales bacterium GWF1_63_6]
MRALTLKVRMDSTHFLTKTKPRFATEMALHVLAYNLPRVLNIMGSKAILKAIAS